MPTDLLPESTPTFFSASIVSEQMVRDLAHSYTRTLGDPFPDMNGFQRWIAAQYVRLPFRVEFVGYDPYRNLEEMTVDFYSTGILKITTRHNDSIFDPEVNLMFRAVHDFDHIQYWCGFNTSGELQACRVISRRCGDELGRMLLFSEIVAQACVAVTQGQFGEQKFVQFPMKTRDHVLNGA